MTHSAEQIKLIFSLYYQVVFTTEPLFMPALAEMTVDTFFSNY